MEVQKQESWMNEWMNDEIMLEQFIYGFHNMLKKHVQLK